MPNPIFKKMPLFRVFIPFALGILAASYFPLSGRHLLVVSFAALLLACIGWRIKWHLLFISGLFLFFSAAGAYQYQNNTSKPKDYSEEPHCGILYIESAPVSTKKRYKYTSRIQLMNKDSTFQQKDKVIAFFPKDSLSRTLTPGNKVFFQGRLSKIRNSGNPGAFEMQKYYASKHISHFLFIDEESWQSIPGDENFESIQLFARSLRYKMITAIKQYIPDQKNRAIIEALSLGYKRELSPELKNRFADAGAMHFLAVSGLHVGIIYLLLAQLFNILGNSYRARKYKTLFIIAGLWGYAFITGLSPSVTRATLMFTFLSAGRILHKETPIYNTILASALLMLWFKPTLLYDVGFQLSYTAVVSIIFFYPKIEALFTFSNGLLRKIWQLTALSLSAQIGTFPLTIFYFSQFPVYFLISNLLVMPLVILILYATALFFILSWWEMAAKLVALLLNYLSEAMNAVVYGIYQLPWSKLEHLHLGGFQIIMLYLAIASLMSWIVHRKSSKAAYLLIFLICYFTGSIFNKIEQSNQKDFIVYQSTNKSLAGIVQGNKANIILNRDIDTPEPEEMKYILKPHHIKSGIKKIDYINQQKNGSKEIYKFVNHNVLFVYNNCWKNYSTKEKYKVDLLILSAGCMNSIENVLELFEPGSVILDSSIYGWKLKVFKEQLKKKQLSYYAVSEKGAFKLSEKQVVKKSIFRKTKKKQL